MKEYPCKMLGRSASNKPRWWWSWLCPTIWYLTPWFVDSNHLSQATNTSTKRRRNPTLTACHQRSSTVLRWCYFFQKHEGWHIYISSTIFWNNESFHITVSEAAPRCFALRKKASKIRWGLQQLQVVERLYPEVLAHLQDIGDTKHCEDLDSMSPMSPPPWRFSKRVDWGNS